MRRRCLLALLGWVAVLSLLLPVRAADRPRGDARAEGLMRRSWNDFCGMGGGLL